MPNRVESVSAAVATSSRYKKRVLGRPQPATGDRHTQLDDFSVLGGDRHRSASRGADQLAACGFVNAAVTGVEAARSRRCPSVATTRTVLVGKLRHRLHPHHVRRAGKDQLHRVVDARDVTDLLEVPAVGNRPRHGVAIAAHADDKFVRPGRRRADASARRARTG